MNAPSTHTQVSAGGIAYRQVDDEIQVALILVGPRQRWQLPKGALNTDEQVEQAALREVREETGLETEMVEPLDRIEYWFYANQGGQRVRFHKYVHFFLMRWTGGDVADHDHEVVEARWFHIDTAIEMLSFDSEKAVMRKARERIRSGAIAGEPR